MIKISIFNKKTYPGLLISLCVVSAFQPIRGQQVQDFVVQNAGTLALAGTAAYAGSWLSDFNTKTDNALLLVPYFKVQNPYYKSNAQELPRHILLYGTSENKL